VYKLLLCWRYLLTRYLALACIISVMLGVATLIVVNSVMSGFSTKLRDKLHGLLSDVVIESVSLDGFADPRGKMARIRAVPFLNERITAMTATMNLVALLQFDWPNGERVTRVVHLVGKDAETQNQVGGFKEYLVLQKDRAEPSFAIPEEARRAFATRWQIMQAQHKLEEQRDPDEPPPPAPPPSQVPYPEGIIVGNLIASFRKHLPDGKYEEEYFLKPGDPVYITTIGGARAHQDVSAVQDSFILVDYFKSGMSEYDNQFVFVPLEYLQRIRSMPDRVSSIQIKLKNYDHDARAVVEQLREIFPDGIYRVETWEDKQGALLQAIAIEKGILNVLLFMIIGVAGFGILAIFTMIVSEKTKDIGILKALGASNWGVMKIFLGYGLLLGLVGAWLGTLLGVSLTENINAVEQFLTRLTGKEIFDRQIYYFDQIPTDIQTWMLVMVNLGAVAISVLFSVLPALRAALLHPVRALRYE
jgi:lipoprotein-releasing system permease protein